MEILHSFSSDTLPGLSALLAPSTWSLSPEGGRGVISQTSPQY